MPANDRMPRLWSRRSLLVSLMAGAVPVLSGCRVRLEDDAPRIPGLPTREPMPDEQALLAARWEALRLKEIATGLGSSATSLTTRLATLHGQQANVFDAVLRSGGVPAAEITAAIPFAATTQSTTPTSGAAGATSTPRALPSGVAGLIVAEAEGLTAAALANLARLSKDRVSLIGCMTAQRAAAVRMLGGRLPSSRAATGPTGDAAALQLEAVRSAVYGFEVVAAQADEAHRVAATKTLELLQSTASRMQRLAGAAAGPLELGYALPFPVSTPADAVRLATHVLTALRSTLASQLPTVVGDAAGLTGTVHVLTDICVQAVTWRVPLTAFPGLVNR